MKKGFTLIELLGVIIALAIVATIATPIILNIVNHAQTEGSKRTADSIGDALKMAYVNYSFYHQGISTDPLTNFCDYMSENFYLTNAKVRTIDREVNNCDTSSPYVEIVMNGNESDYYSVVYDNGIIHIIHAPTNVVVDVKVD